MSRVMIDRSAVDRVPAANRHPVPGTADENGPPWVSPVFLAPLDPDRGCRASSPDTRHARNLTHARLAITVFDSTVEVGWVEAAYFDAVAAQATPDPRRPSRPSTRAARRTSGYATMAGGANRSSSAGPACGAATSSSAAATPRSELRRYGRRDLSDRVVPGPKEE